MATLNTRITLRRPASGEDAAGQPTAGWEAVASVWADPLSLSGRQAIQADAKHSAVSISYRTDSLVGEAQRIRGLIGASSPQSLAAAQAQFTIATAQARAGDQEAAKLLPSLSEAMLALAQAQLSSAVDLRLLRAQTAASLNATAGQLVGRYGLTMPRLATGTNEVPHDMVAMLHAGEAVVPKPFNPALAGGSARDEKLLSELRALREDQRVQASTIVRLQNDVFKLLKRWDTNGQPEVRDTTA